MSYNIDITTLKDELAINNVIITSKISAYFLERRALIITSSYLDFVARDLKNWTELYCVQLLQLLQYAGPKYFHSLA